MCNRLRLLRTVWPQSPQVSITVESLQRRFESLSNVDLGGLSLPELIKRTIRESWNDAVFGQGGRMAFYHFLAIFPALLVLRVAAEGVGAFGPQFATTLSDACRQLLPDEVARIIEQTMADF